MKKKIALLAIGLHSLLQGMADTPLTSESAHEMVRSLQSISHIMQITDIAKELHEKLHKKYPTIPEYIKQIVSHRDQLANDISTHIATLENLDAIATSPNNSLSTRIEKTREFSQVSQQLSEAHTNLAATEVALNIFLKNILLPQKEFEYQTLLKKLSDMFSHQTESQKNA